MSKVILGSGEDGIRTHVPRRTNGFQDRLVMTASIPLRIELAVSCVLFPAFCFMHLAEAHQLVAVC